MKENEDISIAILEDAIQYIDKNPFEPDFKVRIEEIDDEIKSLQAKREALIIKEKNKEIKINAIKKTIERLKDEK